MRVEVQERSVVSQLYVRVLTDDLKDILHCYSDENLGAYNCMGVEFDWVDKGSLHVSFSMLECVRHDGYSVFSTHGEEDYFDSLITKNKLVFEGFPRYSSVTVKVKNEIMAFIMKGFKSFCDSKLNEFIENHTVTENSELVSSTLWEMFNKIFDFLENSEEPFFTNNDRDILVE